MNIETLTPEQLTHDVFKSQIVGLVKKYQKIIDDDITENDTLKWVNEELEQLSTWLTTLNDIDITVTYENLQEQLLTSQTKYDEFVSTLNTKLEEIDQTFEQKENEITQTFEQKSTALDTTFEQKETVINETFNNLGSTIDQTFQEKETSINQTFSVLENFRGLQGLKGDKGDKGDKGIQGSKGDKGDVGTTDYNDLENKPTLGTASSKNVGTSSGDVMPVGAFGLGGSLVSLSGKELLSTYFGYVRNLPTYGGGSFVLNVHYTSNTAAFRLSTFPYTDKFYLHSALKSSDNSGPGNFFNTGNLIMHTGNTTVDANGFIKSASPILNLYTDKIEINNENEFGATPTMQRLEKGVYEIKNTLGLRLNDGWYIETPEDRNGNKYFNVEWEQNIEPTTNNGVLEEYINDIVLTIKVYTRVWNPTTGLHENGELVDINELQSRFIQLRFNELKKEEPIIEDESNG